MAGVAEGIYAEELAAWFDLQASEIEVASNRGALEKIAVAVSGSIKRNFRDGVSPDGVPWLPSKQLGPRKTRGPLRDRGLLMASASGHGEGHVEEIGDVELKYGTALEYAAIHNFGGTIRPKKGKALAIPVTIQAFRAGSPRQFPDPLILLWQRGKTSGRLVLGYKMKGRNKKAGETQYLLVPKAEIPKREFIGWSDSLLEDAANILAEDKAEGLENGTIAG